MKLHQVVLKQLTVMIWVKCIKWLRSLSLTLLMNVRIFNNLIDFIIQNILHYFHFSGFAQQELIFFWEV